MLTLKSLISNYPIIIIVASFDEFCSREKNINGERDIFVSLNFATDELVSFAVV